MKLCCGSYLAFVSGLSISELFLFRISPHPFTLAVGIFFILVIWIANISFVQTILLGDMLSSKLDMAATKMQILSQQLKFSDKKVSN